MTPVEVGFFGKSLVLLVVVIKDLDRFTTGRHLRRTDLQLLEFR